METLQTPVYHILDTETASLSGGVVEIAWIKVDANLNILDEQVHRTNPGVPIEPGAQAIHGISDIDVMGCPSLQDVARTLETPISLIAHNAPFDIRMVSDAIEIKRSLCTLALARKHVHNTTNHKLSTLVKELKLGGEEEGWHSALADVHGVYKLLKYYTSTLNVCLETLFNRGDKPTMLKLMPFGMHRGKPLISVPLDYRRWLLSQPYLDKDLHYTLTKMESI